MSKSLLNCAYETLSIGAERVSPTVPYEKRYCSHWKDNLIVGLPLDEIEQDFGSGVGHELDRKLCAAHSSAALVVNTFGPWRTDPSSLTIARTTGFRSMRFEATCPIWPDRTAPHLDLLADGNSVVAIESKCTEWMETKTATFSATYEGLRPSNADPNWTPWFGTDAPVPWAATVLRCGSDHKHAFGLLRCFGSRKVQLVYLYWEPRNAEDWPECRQHREQADDLADKVRCTTVQLIPMSYRELWEDWRCHNPSSHLEYLRNRYDAEV